MSAWIAILALALQAPAAKEAPKELPTEIDPTVRKLLQLDARDEAFREILSRQIYRGPARYAETLREGTRVNHVLVCPQKQGPPLFAVFLGDGTRDAHRPYGHFVLVDSDGAIICVFHGASAITGADHIGDMDGDGVLDRVTQIRMIRPREGDRPGQGPGVTVLFVVPFSREQSSTLQVVFDRSPDVNVPGGWTWRIRESGGRPRIELGMVMPRVVDIEPAASFEWSAGGYVGPWGGFDQPFMRLEGESREALMEYTYTEPLTAEQQAAQDRALEAIGAAGGMVGKEDRRGSARIEVTLVRGKVDAAGLKDILARLPEVKELRQLSAFNVPIPDEGLDLIGKLEGLRVLQLSGAGITDANLDRLAGLKYLETLVLGGNDITAASLERLSGFKYLEGLGLDDEALRDAVLGRLRGKPVD